MLIKHTALEQHLKKTISPIYLLIGTDQYLLKTATLSIKNAWKSTVGETELTYFTLQQPSDWQTLIEEANYYSLFSDARFIQASYDKKNIEQAGRNALIHYAKTVNQRTLVLICAPQLTTKSTQALSDLSTLTIVQVNTLSKHAMCQWIMQEFNHLELHCSADLVETIYQYTVGNHLACAQVIEKLSLVHSPGTQLTHEDVIVHLSDQCDYQLYELADACLSGDTIKAIHLIRSAAAQKTEAVLILWLLTQEIRLLIQLQHKLNQSISPTQIATQLKIWPQRLRLYQETLKRCNQETLFDLLTYCQQLDEEFKTGKNKQIWEGMEKIALVLSKTSTHGSQYI